MGQRNMELIRDASDTAPRLPGVTSAQVARQELPERRPFGKSRVSYPARPVGFRLKVLCPALSVSL